MADFKQVTLRDPGQSLQKEVCEKQGPRGHAGATGATGAIGGTGPTGATGSSGGSPTGDPDTQAYFGPGGILTDDNDATMSLTNWALHTSPAGAQALRVNRAIRSVATGEGSIASGTNALAQGLDTQAVGDSAQAAGILTIASRQGQRAFSSGQGGLTTTGAGASQVSLVTMTGQTPGSAATEAVELVLGSGALPLILEDGKSYAFTISVTAGGVQPGPTRVTRTFLLYFSARRDGGLSTIAASGVGQSFGDSSTNDWTCVSTVGAAPDRIVLTFTTGAVVTAARVTAAVQFVEILY